jgi:hypothetical protein
MSAEQFQKAGDNPGPCSRARPGNSSVWIPRGSGIKPDIGLPCHSLATSRRPRSHLLLLRPSLSFFNTPRQYLPSPFHLLHSHFSLLYPYSSLHSPLPPQVAPCHRKLVCHRKFLGGTPKRCSLQPTRADGPLPAAGKTRELREVPDLAAGRRMALPISRRIAHNPP